MVRGEPDHFGPAVIVARLLSGKMSALATHPTRLAVLLLLIAVASCGKDNPLKPTSTHQGVILFWGYEGAAAPVAHLYVVNGDGTGFHRLTTDSIPTAEPRWSPDGTKIVCVRGDSLYVVVMNADGSNAIRLGRDFYSHSPCWSPDGTMIAYQKRDSIVVMNADGSDPHAVCPGGSRGFSWATPTMLLIDDSNGIWRWDFGDSLLRPILLLFTGGPGWGHNPRWSPTDSTVLFSGIDPNNPFGGINIFTVKLDGSGLKVLVRIPNGAVYPIWSHDGRRVAYVADALSPREVWTVKRDGSNPRWVVTPDSTAAFLSDWK